MKKFSLYFTRVMLLAVLALVTLSAREDNLPEDLAAHAEKIVGTYRVADQKLNNPEASRYSISIAKSTTGTALIELHNFGNIMYVPITATVRGNHFYIQPQTFKGKTISIVISGAGSFSDTSLHFTYTVNTGHTQLIHQCEATRK
jgi:hypothetical protein